MEKEEDLFVPSSIPSFLLPSQSSQLLSSPISQQKSRQINREDINSSPVGSEREEAAIICSSCKGEDFEENDGLLICNYCGAISTETRTTQNELLEEGGGIYIIIIFFFPLSSLSVTHTHTHTHIYILYTLCIYIYIHYIQV